MSKPTKPKTLKPKAEGEEESAGGAGGGGGALGGMVQLIILVVVILVASIGGSAASLYFLGPMVLVPAIVSSIPQQEGHGEEGEGEHGGEAHQSAGMNLELDEFTVNLKHDPNMKGTQYLRAKIALTVNVPKEEDCMAPHAEGEEHAAAGGEGGGHGGAAPAADPAEACQKEFNTKMGRFVPTIRDIVNASLMNKTAGNLGTLEGQETLKDEIKQEINALMKPARYEVARVNFEDFIVQR